MEGMEEKLGSILNNPEMMQKIMAIANSMNANQGTQSPPKEQPSVPALGDIDVNLLQKISGLARQGNIDKEQQALLKALTPYLSRERLHKLENAMRAAKMARIAATALGNRGSLFSSAR